MQSLKSIFFKKIHGRNDKVSSCIFIRHQLWVFVSGWIGPTSDGKKNRSFAILISKIIRKIGYSVEKIWNKLDYYYYRTINLLKNFVLNFIIFFTLSWNKR